MNKPVVIIIGTRPEGIKMIPVYLALKEAEIPTVICSTGQHNELLTEVFDVFDVQPDYNLGIMRSGQDLFYVTTEILEKIKHVFANIDPSLVLVQGDTTSAMAAALAAFYMHIPIGHIEAGLRTINIRTPFPEEMNRRFISLIATFHCAPTASSMGNLLAEGIDRSSIVCTGNTVVDALRIMKEKIISQKITIDETIRSLVETTRNKKKHIVLLTMHRRESFNGGIQQVLYAIKEFSLQRPDVVFIYPYHPNPQVVQAINDVGIDKVKNIFLCKPLMYKDLTYILLHANWVATDSGGICEEAVSLNKPVLILRNETERMEAVWEGIAILVGTNKEVIMREMEKKVHKEYLQKEKENNAALFGDGFAAQKIVEIVKRYINFFSIQQECSKRYSNTL
jgi:UDP-N-acetylglucosamine 2-epimerase (non-hydrolysing)